MPRPAGIHHPPPATNADSSKPWICHKIQRLAPPPSRTMKVELVSAAIAQREEGEEKSDAANAVVDGWTFSPAPLGNPATQTKVASSWTQKKSTFPHGNWIEYLAPSSSTQARTGKPSWMVKKPSSQLSLEKPSPHPRRRPPEMQPQRNRNPHRTKRHG